MKDQIRIKTFFTGRHNGANERRGKKCLYKRVYSVTI